MRNRAWVCGLLVTLAGCGYSEDEWQAQLHKYEELSAQNKKEQEARASTQAQLDEAARQVLALKEQLQKMGFSLDTVNQQLEQSGTKNQELAKNIEELARALDEYKARAAQLEKIRARFELLRDKRKKLTELGLKVEFAAIAW